MAILAVVIGTFLLTCIAVCLDQIRDQLHDIIYLLEHHEDEAPIPRGRVRRP